MSYLLEQPWATQAMSHLGRFKPMEKSHHVRLRLRNIACVNCIAAGNDVTVTGRDSERTEMEGYQSVVSIHGTRGFVRWIENLDGCVGVEGISWYRN